MSKQLACQKYIYKIHSSRLRKAGWKLTLPLAEARRNDEVIELADSQILRWLDELNGITDAEEQARETKKEIRRLRRENGDLTVRRKIKEQYALLDEIQFKPDYLCVIIDKIKDYHRACKGFSINGVRYCRLLGTNGGIKNETIVFVAERHAEELKRRVENDRKPDGMFVPAKLEAYKALTCSASIPVSMPNGILVVPDCTTKFLADTIYLDDEQDGEPLMENRPDTEVELDESDGYGLMLPSLAERWSEELQLGYTAGGMNTRFSWEKGMVFTFDFIEFAEKVAGGYIVRDAWGTEVDIRDVELILTTSMLKLWDSYGSCAEYVDSCLKNGYTFGIPKVCPKELETERTLNYQFIQSYDLDDCDIEELIRPTLEEIHDVLHGDRMKTILFLKGVGLTSGNVAGLPNDYAKALMIEPAMMNDPYVQNGIYQMIRNRINEAKVGKLKVHGNYSIVSGDPYSLCQSIFGLPVTGLLKSGEIYNEYWCNQPSDELVCFRAPMTCHANIRRVRPNRSDETRYWYRYMNTATIFNSWDTAAHALNGMDKDGDLVMLTDNDVLVRKHVELPAIMCIQRKASKKVVEESDLIQSNIDSFGDDIGKTTNWITSMFEVQAQFPKDSLEYQELNYRIMCGQLFQQNAIDKAKGIIAKPMPREWHDRHAAASVDDPERRSLYLKIAADRKPYFMRYIYPDLMRKYNTYIKNTDKSCLREFQVTVDELLSVPEEERTERQREFLRFFHMKLPVGINDCVMNRICRRFEKEFDGYLRRRNVEAPFDYTVMKSGAECVASQRSGIVRLYEEYNRRLRNYTAYANYERIDECEVLCQKTEMFHEFIEECTKVCPNRASFCDIALDVCYMKSATKRFAWELCGDDIIANLLGRNDGIITYPTLDPTGDIEYGGKRFRAEYTYIGETNEHCTE